MSGFDPDPNLEEEYWNIVYYFRCLDKKHQAEIIKQLQFEMEAEP